MEGIDPANTSQPYEISVSFNRSPHEAVAVMFAASKRFSRPAADESSFGIWVVVIVLAAMLGVGMEFYRQYVLPQIFKNQLFPSFPTAMAYFAPVFLFIVVLMTAYLWRRHRVLRKRLISRLAPQCIIDIDVTALGLKVGTNDMVVFVPWKSIRQVAVADKRIECDTENSVIYLPERAFSDQAAFKDAFKRMHLLWRHGMEAAMAVREKPGQDQPESRQT